MIISPKKTALLVMTVSPTILLLAIGFQYVGGLQPCYLCHWQRWPYVFTFVLSVLILTLSSSKQSARTGNYIFFYITFVFLLSTILSTYHLGIEEKWWAGVSKCSEITVVKNLPLDELRKKILETPIARCDQPPWDLFGISLAGYNVLFSIVLMVSCLWISTRIYATRKSR